jgi:hypothetical protein
MANSDSLKLTVQATGSNSGTWGQITNTNLLILEQAIGGYDAIGVTSGATLAFSNGVLSNGKNQVIKLTGTITSNVDVVVPDSGSGTAPKKTYIVENATTGAFTVTFKTTSGTGVTWAATDKGTKMIYSDGTNVVDTGFNTGITEVSEDTSPQLGGNLDTNSFNIQFDDAKGITDDSDNEQLIFQKTSSAVNHFEITNAATGNSPAISVAGDDTNIGLNITTKGSGDISVTGNLIPGTDDTFDLGSTSAVWQNIYTGDLHLSNKNKSEGNIVDGTKGNWTLQEGENDIFMINNISGEKFKINLSKIEGDL